MAELFVSFWSRYATLALLCGCLTSWLTTQYQILKARLGLWIINFSFYHHYCHLWSIVKLIIFFLPFFLLIEQLSCPWVLYSWDSWWENRCICFRGSIARAYHRAQRSKFISTKFSDVGMCYLFIYLFANLLVV